MANCQRCTIAYELRRRGLDVEALPKPRKDWICHDGQYASMFDNPSFHSIGAYGSRKSTKALMDSFGDGSRAIVQIDWNAKDGHVFIAEQIGGKTYFVDPQRPFKNAEEYFQMGGGVTVVRIDNLKINAIVQQCCKSVGKK